ncbi:MAG: hypothetical protein JSS07_01405 [Proteobacteria bacterium]|nr:hypothetical protein [Pseudomonadota bacterium]
MHKGIIGLVVGIGLICAQAYAHIGSESNALNAEKRPIPSKHYYKHQRHQQQSGHYQQQKVHMSHDAQAIHAYNANPHRKSKARINSIAPDHR